MFVCGVFVCLFFLFSAMCFVVVVVLILWSFPDKFSPKVLLLFFFFFII